jgi:3-deoxy-manno-octulosonate cytidylyltransferase (CMP-KDO synthetase)
MHILPIIPARFESERFPGKLLEDYKRHPVCWWPARACLDAFGECFVVTSDFEILSLTKETTLIYMHGNYRNGTERIADACNRLNVSDETLIMHVQGDEVGLRPEDLKRLAECSCIHSSVRTLFYCTEDEKLLKSPNSVKCWGWGDKGCTFGRSLQTQTIDPDGIHVGVYCYRRSMLHAYMARWPTDDEKRERLEQLRWDVPIIAYKVAPCKAISDTGSVKPRRRQSR